MTFARKLLFDHTKPVVCHCVSRCVRRLFLTQEEKWRRVAHMVYVALNPVRANFEPHGPSHLTSPPEL